MGSGPQWLLVKAYFSRKPELEHGFQSSHVVKNWKNIFKLLNLTGSNI